MENITEEIRAFLSTTGLPQCVLAKEAGVSAATISRIWKKKQHEMVESRAKNIRAAMSRLLLTAAPNTPTAPEEASHELA